MTKRSCYWWCRLFLAGVVGVSLLASCGLVEPGVNEGELGVSSDGAMSVVHQEGAPFPADVEHLEDILAIPPGNSLPVGAEVVSVEPAVKFAEYYEGGWGYVIAFTAEEQAIRDYVDEHTSFSSSAIDDYIVASGSGDGLNDVELESISRPWRIGFGNAKLVLERPLGRGWLLIRGAPR